MPHATASWLVDNTSLSFEQIAESCGLHILEVQAMADDLASSKYTGRDPIHSGELTHGEIERGQADHSYVLQMHKAPVQVSRTKGPRHTPESKRQDKPDGIAWILRNHPEISDAQNSRLIGTTRNTITAIRDRSHWNIANIQPKDPVTLGLCSQRELDALVAKAAKQAGSEAQPQAGRLAGRAPSRGVVTHFHPDHIGLAGWLTRRFGLRLWMTREEWLYARMLVSDIRDAPPKEAIAHWRAAGWDEERIAVESARGWGRFASAVSDVP